MYRLFFKCIIDFIIALIALVIFSPLFLLVAFILTYKNNRKVFFKQERPGKDAKIFKVIKFKTMNERVDDNGKLLPDADRLTKLGKFIRKTSLDELPQLVNVLKGDMSLVGPRPLLTKYLPLFNEEQKRRHEVRPGITGWAQVNGRNSIRWEDKFKMDVWYIDHVSFWLDIRIIFLTLRKVLLREGINNGDGVTMTAFKGNDMGNLN